MTDYTGTGGVVIPLAVPVGEFVSDRPTQNEFIPSVEDCYQTFIKLLPRGRAFGTHDLSIPRTNSPLRQFFYALALERSLLEQKAVALLDEAFCRFAVQDVDGWLADVMSPDDVEPYGVDVCVKAGTIGDLSLDDYRQIAERALWVLLEIRFLKGDDAAFPGVVSTLYIKADVTSPAVPPSDVLDFTFVLDVSRLDSPQIAEAVTRLERLFDKAVPAHVDILIEAA